MPLIYIPLLEELTALEYYCMADEIGLETQTPHTHLFLMLRNSTRFSRIKKLFPDAHIEKARGTAQQNRSYVQKSDKWANDPKADTSVPGTFEEWGEMPEEPGQGARTDIAAVYDQIQNGLSNVEIMAANPNNARYINLMDRVRQEVLEAQHGKEWRDLDITYIFGPTKTGKTRGVMEKHGYGNVYRVTDYKHPFDRYAQEPVMCFDEFRSSLPVGDMLTYLDDYPIALPARYTNRQACFDTVYIISNIDLREQYPNVQQYEPETWKAFLRRINQVIEYRATGPPIEHGNGMDYIFPPPPPVPDWVQEADQSEQTELPF